MERIPHTLKLRRWRLNSLCYFSSSHLLILYVILKHMGIGVNWKGASVKGCRKELQRKAKQG